MPSGAEDGPKLATAASGIIVSWLVDTEEPVEAPPRALLTRAFCCWLRTKSPAMSAAVRPAVDVTAVVLLAAGAMTVVPATAPLAWVPLIEPPEVLI